MKIKIFLFRIVLLIISLGNGLSAFSQKKGDGDDVIMQYKFECRNGLAQINDYSFRINFNHKSGWSSFDIFEMPQISIIKLDRFRDDFNPGYYEHYPEGRVESSSGSASGIHKFQCYGTQEPSWNEGKIDFRYIILKNDYEIRNTCEQFVVFFREYYREDESSGAKIYLRKGYSGPLIEIPGWTNINLEDYVGEIKERTDYYVVVRVSNEYIDDGNMYLEDERYIELLPKAPQIDEGDIIINPSCSNINSGKIEIESGNVQSVSNYKWSLVGAVGSNRSGNVSKDQGFTIEGVSAGNYTLKVMNPGGNMGGCDKTFTIVVPEIAPVNISADVVTQPKCFGDKGSIKLTYTGSNPVSVKVNNISKTLILNESAKEVTISDLLSGSNVITLIDNCGSISNITITINAIIQPTLSVIETTHLNCSNTTSNGKIKIKGKNNSGKLNLKIFKGLTEITAKSVTITGVAGVESEYTFTNLEKGDYTIKLHDANSPTCTPVEATTTIQEATALNATVSITNSIKCKGGKADIEITGVGCGAGYKYTIKKGSTSIKQETLTGKLTAKLEAGVYIIEVERNISGCLDKKTITQTITEPQQLVSNLVVTNALCNIENASDNKVKGSITANSTGGTSPYLTKLYVKGTSSPIVDYTQLTQREYVLVTTDANSCEVKDTFKIQAPAELKFQSLSASTIICSGDDIQLSLAGQGGTGAYSYKYKEGVTWTNLPASNKITNNKTAGNHNVYIQIQDANGCIKDSQVSIFNPQVLTITANSPQYNGYNISCKDGTNGAINLQATGGSGVRSFKLGTGAYSNKTNYTGLSANTYTIYVKDGLSCEKSEIITLTEPSKLNITASSKVDVHCSESTSGSINLATTGGVTPYKYKYNDNTLIGNVITNLGAGTYAAKVIDNNNCEASLANTTILNKNDLTLNIQSAINPDCENEQNGQIQLTATGGLGSYQYTKNGTWQTSNIFDSLDSGNYTFSVKTADDCKISVNKRLDYLFKVKTKTKTHTTCSNTSTGQIEVESGGLSGSYLYQLEKGDEIVNAWQVSPIFTNLSTGIYTITAKSALNTCELSYNDTIEALTTLNISVLNKIDVHCQESHQGELKLSGLNGDGNYQYSLDDGDWQTSNIFQNIEAGLHTVNIKDGVGCENTTFSTINIVNPLQITETYNKSAYCDTHSGGEIKLSVSGAKNAYKYDIGRGWQDSAHIVNLIPNNYVVTVKDTLTNCTLIHNTQIGITNVLGLSIIDQHNIPCADATIGTIELQAHGNYGAYKYKADAGNWQTNNIIENLGLGNHTLTLTDTLSGCETSIHATIIIEDTLNLTITNIENVPCTNAITGVIEILATGASGRYSYKIDDRTWQAEAKFINLGFGLHTITVRDSISDCEYSITKSIIEENKLEIEVVEIVNIPCVTATTGKIRVTAKGAYNKYAFRIDNGTWQSDSLFVNVGYGQHTIEVTDSISGCITPISAQISISDPIKLVLDSKGTVPCNMAKTAFIKVSASGALGGYQYKLKDNTVWQTDSLINNVGYGVQYVIVEDTISGCSTNLGTTIDIANVLQMSIQSQETVPCAEAKVASVAIKTTGALGNYKYKIGDRAWQIDSIFDKLDAGIHTIVVQDSASGCTSNINANITVANSLQMAILSQSTVPCVEAEVASAEIKVLGGLGNYQYKIDGGIWQNNPVFNELNGGYHTIVVKDSSLCLENIDVNIKVANPLKVSLLSKDKVECENKASSQITIKAEGALGKYIYKIDDRSWQTSNQFTNVTHGNRIIVVQDSSKCEQSIEVPIELQPKILYTQTSRLDVPCDNAASGQIGVGATGGVGSYQYKINDRDWQNEPIFKALLFGKHTIKIKDSDNCIVTYTDSVFNAGNMKLNRITQNTVPCEMAKVGIATMQVTGSLNYPFKFRQEGKEWQLDDLIQNLSAGINKIEVIDTSGCIASTLVDIAINDNLQLSVISKTDVPCEIARVGELAVKSEGGGGSPYTYKVDNRAWQTSNIFNALSFGSHQLQVKDQYGCLREIEAEIGDMDNLKLYSINVKHSPCVVASDGLVELFAESGAGSPYSYKVDGKDWQNSPKFTNLTVGKHIFTVKDSLYCTREIEATINNLDNLKLNVLGTVGVPCVEAESGSVNVIASSGAGAPYQYKIDGNDWQSSEEFAKLGVGNYTIIVKDSLSCLREVEANISTTLPEPKVSLIMTEVNCHGGNDGKLEATAIDGIKPYTYNWLGYSETTNILSGLSKKEYYLEITDSVGCKAGISAGVEEPEKPLNIMLNTKPACFDRPEGIIYLFPEGGTIPYKYVIDSKEYQENIITDKKAGLHEIKIIDARNCEVYTKADIVQNNIDPTVNFLVATDEMATNNLILKEISVPIADSIIWEFSPYAKIIERGNSPIISFDNEGEYLVSMTAFYEACDFKVDKMLNVKPYELVEVVTKGTGIISVEAFPNPNYGQFNLKIKQHTEKPLNISIYNILGAKIFDKNVSGLDFNEIVNPQNMVPGIYIIRVQSENNYKIFRILVK